MYHNEIKSQHDDPVNGNDFISHCFGPGGVLRHKQFKVFFAVQEPRLKPPSRKNHPTFKIDSFLKPIQDVPMKAWILRKMFSVDEQTSGFQGSHIIKLCITYKQKDINFNAMQSVRASTHTHSTSDINQHLRNI
eukprot:11069695-Ditylum_brightwellii.AAC.1